MVVAEGRAPTVAAQEIEGEIRQLLASEQRVAVLERRLFAPEGLFGRLAPSEPERRKLVGSQLYREAQKRITELQRSEHLQRQLASAEASTTAAVFTVIGSRLFSQTAEIAAFARTGCSFEEWCNWEALSACSTAGFDWKVTPTPGCRHAGSQDSRELGDLLIEDHSRRSAVLVAFDLVHDTSFAKGGGKLQADAGKLEQSTFDGVVRLQVILAVTVKEQPSESGGWRPLETLELWQSPAPLERTCGLCPQGKMVLRGWPRFHQE